MSKTQIALCFSDTMTHWWVTTPLGSAELVARMMSVFPSTLPPGFVRNVSGQYPSHAAAIAINACENSMDATVVLWDRILKAIEDPET